MPAGSQYGIDVGNILSQSSNIRTARLNRERNQLALDKEKAGIKLREDELDRKSNLLAEEATDESMQGGMEGGYSEPIETLPQEEVNRLSAIAPEAAATIQKTKQDEANIANMTQFYVGKGDSKEEASLKAQGFAKEIQTANTAYMKVGEEVQGRMRDYYARTGNQVQSLMEVAKQDPMQAEKMYQTFLNGRNEEIKQLYKTGQTDIADKLQKTVDSSPNTLIKDGRFNFEYTTLKLSQLDQILTNAETYDKDKVAQQKQADRIALEKEKQKKPSKTGGSDFERVLASMNLTPAEERAYKKAWLTKKTQPDRTSLLINMQTVQKAQSDFANTVGLDSPFKLAAVDTRTWTPEQQAQGNQVASVIIKGLGANAKLAEKKMGEYGALSDQMQNAINAYQDVGSFRAVDEATKAYFSNYFGLSEKELQSSEAAMAFQSMLNIKIKADSGSAVSGQEMVRNTLETASPYMSKEKILLGVKNVAKRYMGELKSLKKVMGPVAFNLKYGTTLSNYEDIANAAEAEKAPKKEDEDDGFTPFKAETQKKTVAERRTAPDGRTIVKYSDNTYGVE